MPTRLHFLASPPAAREWLTTEQLARHGGFSSGEAVRAWLRRHPDFPIARAGGRGHILIDRAVFDRYVVEQGEPTRRVESCPTRRSG
jgi:hypothetical protein